MLSDSSTGLLPTLSEPVSTSFPEGSSSTSPDTSSPASESKSGTAAAMCERTLCISYHPVARCGPRAVTSHRAI